MAKASFGAIQNDADSWEACFGVLKDWIARRQLINPSGNCHLPKASALSLEERRLAAFLNRTQSRHRNGKLSQSRQDMMCSVPELKERFMAWVALAAKSLPQRKSKAKKIWKDKVFAWHGSKNQQRNFILKHVPLSANRIVSPFFGSGAVEFALLRSRPKLHVRAFDLHGALVTFWEELFASPQRLFQEIETLLPEDVVPSPENFMSWGTTIKQEPATTEVAPRIRVAACFWLVNHLSFNSSMSHPAYSSPRAEHLKRLRGKMLLPLQNFCPLSAERLCIDVRDSFDAISTASDQELLFLDPPYMATRALKPDDKKKAGGVSGRHYAVGANWGLHQHERLRDLLRERSRWILCHEDHPTIRELYKEFAAVSYTQGAGISRKVGGSRKELLIMSPWVLEKLPKSIRAAALPLASFEPQVSPMVPTAVLNKVDDTPGNEHVPPIDSAAGHSSTSLENHIVGLNMAISSAGQHLDYLINASRTSGSAQTWQVILESIHGLQRMVEIAAPRPQQHTAVDSDMIPDELTKVGYKYVGKVSQLHPSGNGFIDCASIRTAYGADVFFRRKDLLDCGAVAGDIVAFNIQMSQKGTPMVAEPCIKLPLDSQSRRPLDKDASLEMQTPPKRLWHKTPDADSERAAKRARADA